MKTFSIQTKQVNNGRSYAKEVGKLVEDDGRLYLDLYMYPNTRFYVKEDFRTHVIREELQTNHES